MYRLPSSVPSCKVPSQAMAVANRKSSPNISKAVAVVISLVMLAGVALRSAFRAAMMVPPVVSLTIRLMPAWRNVVGMSSVTRCAQAGCTDNATTVKPMNMPAVIFMVCQT